MKNSSKIALAGVLTALSVVLLCLGGAIWILSYTMPLFCGLTMIMIIDSADKKTALITYIAVSLISFFAVSDKETALVYIFFFGYYPIIKDKLDKIRNKLLRLLLKLAIFNAAMIGAQLVLIYVFVIPFEDFLGKLGVALLLLGANALFFVYEKLFDGVTYVYRRRLKSKIEKYLK